VELGDEDGNRLDGDVLFVEDVFADGG
jgi:hypothetical protein